MTRAEHLLANPTDELRETAAVLQRASATSKSEARKDFAFQDGSAVVVTSRQGGEAQFTVIQPAGTKEA